MALNELSMTKYHTSELSESTFLVTGGAGFIGSHLAEYLVKFGAKKVVVLDNLSTGSLVNIQHLLKEPNFVFFENDIRDLNACMEASAGIDYILHQAALGSVPRSIEDPITSNEVNVSGFLNMLLAAREQKVKKIVYAASSSTYGDSKVLPKVEHEIGKPLSPYAVTKYVNELYADVFSRLYGMDIVGLRYFNVFGPRQNPTGPYAAVIPLFIEAIINNQSPIINGDGEQTRDFTYIENVVQANILAITKTKLQEPEHMVMNIACGDRTSLNQLWNTLCEISNSGLQALYRESRVGDVKDSLASIELAKRNLGYSPDVKISDGLRSSFEWYKARRSIMV